MSGSVVLISTYELGRQSFGVASACAWLEAAGATVSVEDLSVREMDPEPIRDADLIAFFVPMHTATRLAEPALDRVKEINESAHICFFGLYAPINGDHLRDLGADTVLGGEFEQGLVNAYNLVIENGNQGPSKAEVRISLNRQKFKVPNRTGLPGLDKYAKLQVSPDVSRVVGYTEASRGCKHLCRHCPVVPVYRGKFIVVQKDVVLEDIRRQVKAGAEHITFGDPDFFNGPVHALGIVRSMHREFPNLTYDVTIKVGHLAKYSHLLTDLAATGCVMVTSAVESFDDHVLEKFDKRHTREDLENVLASLRDIGLALNPTFVTFTPWTTIEGYIDFLSKLASLDLVHHISSVQYAIRLLIPAGSKLLELREITDLVDEFDDRQLVYPWRHSDPDVDRLFDDVVRVANQGKASELSRVAIFNEIWIAAHAAAGRDVPPPLADVPSEATIPYLTEPWYC